MLNTFLITKDLKVNFNLPLEAIRKEDVLWYWVDFNEPDVTDRAYLDEFFHFHQLSIEDCTDSLSNPKIDFYDDYNFFVFNSLKQNEIVFEEICAFANEKFLVTYHENFSGIIDLVWQKLKDNIKLHEKGTTYVLHQILDKMVDGFFPAVYSIEERLNDIECNVENKPTRKLIDQVFQVRTDLLKLRRIINSMRDLLYRIINSERLHNYNIHKHYFNDIYDHLVKLSEILENSREITSDMRDSYLSLTSSHMNQNMMVLTVITTIFIPLTFIVGVYGMNFQNMPELTWKYGYFLALFIMAVLGSGMFLWFKKKGWFDK